MRKILSIAAALSISLSPQAHAFGVSPAIVYSKLSWNFSSKAVPFVSCSYMVLDVTGNLNTTSRFVAYGTLYCEQDDLAATGSAFRNFYEDSYNLTLTFVTFAGGAQLVCGNLSSNTLSGTCSVFNSSGLQIGTAVIGYVP